MTGRNKAAHALGALFCGMLAIGLPLDAKAADTEAATTAAATAAADDGPATLREAIDMMAQHFDFTVIGANRLGNDAPSWPAEDLAPEATLAALLKDYSYIVLLKPEAAPGAAREPETLSIVSVNHAPSADPAPPAVPVAGYAARPPVAAKPAAPAAATAAQPVSVAHVPTWAPRPSTVVRALTKLATTNGGSGDQSSQPATPLPDPAQNASAMAALTRSAQTGLGALVTGLRQACPNPKAC